MKIGLVHGFNVRDGGARTVDMLAPRLEDKGHVTDKDTADYGHHDLIDVRFRSKKTIQRIAEAMEGWDAAITHSNGGNYTMQAAYLISRPIILLHISPALNKKTNVPAVVSHMAVFHTTKDTAVKWSRVLRFGHPWGAMGAFGYMGQDTRVVNHDFSFMVNGHSDWFTPENADYFADRAIEVLEEYYA